MSLDSLISESRLSSFPHHRAYDAQTQLELKTEDMGGFVRVFMCRGEPAGKLALYLSHSLTEWMRKNPHRRIRMIVSVVRNGDAAELHACYDQVIFPDTGRMKEKHG